MGTSAPGSVFSYIFSIGFSIKFTIKKFHELNQPKHKIWFENSEKHKDFSWGNQIQFQEALRMKSPGIILQFKVYKHHWHSMPNIQIYTHISDCKETWLQHSQCIMGVTTEQILHKDYGKLSNLHNKKNRLIYVLSSVYHHITVQELMKNWFWKVHASLLESISLWRKLLQFWLPESVGWALCLKGSLNKTNQSGFPRENCWMLDVQLCL